MPLTLITGPANAAKAGRVLDACLAALDREPLLVVPRFEDVGLYHRELADRGAVFGVRVLRFGRLWEEIARRTDLRVRAVAPLEREWVVRAAVERAGLRTLAASAGAPGFRGAVETLVDELQAACVEPAELGRALDGWAGPAGDRRAYARDVAALYGAYREMLAASGALDAAGTARAALDRLAADPGAWGGTPVLLYGFDDLTALELRGLEALAGDAGADVTVSLTWEDGREAFASRSRTVERLRAVAVAEERLPAQAEHYAPEARAALHHLERSLFRAQRAETERPDPGDTVRLLEAGGDRNEVELIAAEVLALLRAGVPHGEIAVVFRSPNAYASLVESVFRAYGIPVACERPRRLVHSAFGRALLGLLRCALGTGDAADLLAYLRAPGKLDQPHVVDRLEARLRRDGIVTAPEARAVWERHHPELDELDAVTAAAAAGAAPLCETLARSADGIFTAPHAGRGRPLTEEQAVDAAAHAAVTAALAELAALPDLSGCAPAGGADVLDALERIPVRSAARPATDAVVLAGPLAVRARRFRALVLGGLQEDEFPRPPRPEPFLPEDVRHHLIGQGLELRDDAIRLGDERFLFYAVASRPHERLLLSWRTSDEEGRPLVRSFFVDEVRALFSPRLDAARRRRDLGDVTWAAAEAPTAEELERSLRAAAAPEPPAPIAPITWPAAVAALREPRVMSPGALESFAQCPVKWLVDKRLRAQPLAPDAEGLRRGGFAHALLERTLTRLREETGSARLTAASLPAAERLLDDAAEELRSAHHLGESPAQARAVARRLAAHVRRLLRWEAAAPGPFAPARLEVWFGPEADAHGDGADEERLPALELGGGELIVHGRVDRVDRADGGRAIVRDYKLGAPTTEYQEEHWETRGQLQVAMYMLAVRAGLGWELAGGVYQALRASGTRLRPRGLLLDVPEVTAAVPGVFAEDDVREPAAFEAALHSAETRALELARAMRSGATVPTPDTCGYRGSGCAYPGICRSVGA